MSAAVFEATSEQLAILRHDGPAFVRACPGAGKTRVIVEMARRALWNSRLDRATAFLSFTTGAIDTLERQMREQRFIRGTPFPHFIGTFDSFVWHFFVSPFGDGNPSRKVTLIPDKDQVVIRPFPNAQALPLSCFDRDTGELASNETRRYGFKVDQKSPSLLKAYKTAAIRRIHLLNNDGYLDFTDARGIAIDVMRSQDAGERLQAAMSGRFSEIVVDEAQDCNPEDLTILSWLRDAGIAVKVVCDPFQSIYEFRGGVTEELLSFAESYDPDCRLSLTGNFRSSAPICRAIATLRPASHRDGFDKPLGPHCRDTEPVHLVSYPGRSVPTSIGAAFTSLVGNLGISPIDAPIVAATVATAQKAIGQPAAETRHDLALSLAESVTNFHFAFHWHKQVVALQSTHEVLLHVSGEMIDETYHQCVHRLEIEPSDWRPQIMEIVTALRYDTAKFSDARVWLATARELLGNWLPAGGRSIAQVLRWNSQLPNVLTPPPKRSSSARTIHSVKGLEFPAIGVVTVPQKLKSILDFLETGEPRSSAEMARELYVAASRAQRLLVVFAPASQAERFAKHLCLFDAPVMVESIESLA